MASLVAQGLAVCCGRFGHLEDVVGGIKLGLTVVLELKAVAAASVTEDHPKGS